MMIIVVVMILKIIKLMLHDPTRSAAGKGSPGLTLLMHGFTAAAFQKGKFLLRQESVCSHTGKGSGSRASRINRRLQSLS
jgi:hypothetical protein